MSTLRRGAWLVATTICVVLGIFLMSCSGGALQTPAVPAHKEREGGPIRPRQWALDRLHVPDVWPETRGKGIIVAMLDTGVDERHPDLKGRILLGPDLNETGRARGRHGTAMAGIIAGNGTGMTGIAPQAMVLSIRVTADDAKRQAGHRNALATGIRYAADHGAKVISMSLGTAEGSYSGSEVEEKAIAYARQKGAVLIASAGNDGKTDNRMNYPAAYREVIAVGAVNRDGRLAGFSNRRDYVDVTAPGVEIISAQGKARYSVGAGTSSAAAHVAGIAALLRARYPELTPDQIRHALRMSASSGGDREARAGHGYGMVDAHEALVAASGFAGESPPASPALESTPLAISASSGDSSRWLAGFLFLGIALVCAVASFRRAA